MADTRLATKRQTFALFCITKTDYRNTGLTYDEVSELIDKLNKENGYVSTAKKTAVVKHNKAKEIHDLAVQAGLDAMTTCVPVPMVVQQHASSIDDKSPVIQEWHVADGVCGFASIQFKATTKENRSFLAGLKAALASAERNTSADWQKDDTRGGYYYWVSQGGQSLQKKEAFARAFADVLHNQDITCYVYSNMD